MLLYHGSPQIIEGALEPREGNTFGIDVNPEDLLKAVYATNERHLAIIMAIMSLKGVLRSSLDFDSGAFGVIHEGWPKLGWFNWLKPKCVYLYVLDAADFEQGTENRRQWYSLDPVSPMFMEKIKVKEHLHLIRKCNPDDKY